MSADKMPSILSRLAEVMTKGDEKFSQDFAKTIAMIGGASAGTKTLTAVNEAATLGNAPNNPVPDLVSAVREIV